MFNLLTKIKNLYSKFHDLSSLTTSTLITQTLSAMFLIYLAPLLGDEGYGEVSYLLAIAHVASTVAFLGAGNTVLVYTAKKIPIQGPVFYVSIISGLITSFVLYLILQSIETSIFVIGFVIFAFSSNEMIGRKLYGKYGKYLIAQRVIQITLSIGLYYIIGIPGIILGYAFSYFSSAQKV